MHAVVARKQAIRSHHIAPQWEVGPKKEFEGPVGKYFENVLVRYVRNLQDTENIMLEKTKQL
jgi:hypothetical protein